MSVSLDAGRFFALMLSNCSEPISFKQLYNVRISLEERNPSIFIDLSRQAIEHAIFFNHDVFQIRNGSLVKSDQFDSLFDMGYFEGEFMGDVPLDLAQQVSDICSYLMPTSRA